ncbi:MAG: phosphonate C-P lyase system protein PhnL [Thioalkalispiraceae bacterium]|jgi:alpha-D-ribose 1-methylphosphonate 5-triphosphate synthase subunit PhnL
MQTFEHDHNAILTISGYSKYFEIYEQGSLIPSSHDVNLSVYPGRLTALVGPSGSGKSSVLKGVYRTYLPSSGRILYRCQNNHELDLVQTDEHRILELRHNEISFVTQFLHVLPRKSTEEVVAYPLVQRGVDKTSAIQRAHELLTALSLPERLWGIAPATFSGGEKQRVNLARGLISNPRLLLLDEPTASLDSDTTQIVINLLADLKREGVAMLAIFHDPQLVDALADEVIELNQPVAITQMLEEIAK